MSAAAQGDGSASPERPRRSLLRRFAPAAIALAVAGLLSPVSERWPSSHPLELTLESPSSIRRVSLSVRGDADEAIHEATWNFGAAGAPDRLHTTIHAPHGAYEMHVDVARDGEGRVSRAHRVELGDGRTVVHAR